MKIHRFVSQYLSSNCYQLVEDGHSLVIDPCQTAETEAALQSAPPEMVLLTHEHSDHISGVEWVQTHFQAPVLCSKACAENIADARMNYSRYYNVTCKMMDHLTLGSKATMVPFVCHADQTFIDNSVLNWRGHRFVTKLTPGHSKGGVCFLVDDQMLFAGDTLFRDEATITGYKGGSRKELSEITIPWLKTLDPQTLIYPGHFEPFVLTDWCGWNQIKEGIT